MQRVDVWQQHPQQWRQHAFGPCIDCACCVSFCSRCRVLQVKQRFYEAFKGDGYPEAFIYRQRVIVLFQKIDGVDVALYCMYVQEYGQDCAPPNRNVVYLSYIDR